MSKQDFQQPLDSSRYRWLPQLIILMNLVAVAAGIFLYRSVEHRLIFSAGEELRIAAAEVSDKLDRLLFERYGDAQMMARAFALRSSDPTYLSNYLVWMKTNYRPIYLWLGVTDRHGMMVAVTDAAMRGRDVSHTGWFQRARATKTTQMDDVAVHDPEIGTEAVAFTTPILDAAGTFQGVVTSRVAMSTLEDVTTRTLRSLEARQEFAGAVVFQMVTSRGVVFVDSDLRRKGPLGPQQTALLASKTDPFSDAGFVEEDYRDRPVVTGFATTKGFGDFSGLGWHVLVRMDRDRILEPITSIVWKVGITGAVVWIPMVWLLFWSTSHLRAEYQQVQQESSWARAAEAALLQSQERNRAIVETALDALVTVDAAGIVTDWNRQASAVFGWSREEALGQRLSELIIPTKDREAHEAGLRQYLATGDGQFLNRRVEVQALRRSGEEFPVELAISPVRVGGTIFFSAFIRDITERREAETKLRESEVRYRSVVNALDEGVVVIDGDGVVRAGNASAERILGLPSDQLIGRSLHDARWRMIHEDGSVFRSEDSPPAVTLRTGDPCASVIMGVYRPDGRLRWIDINSRPLPADGGTGPSAVVVSFSDITERKRAEERLTAQYAVTRVLAESRSLEEAVPKIMQAVGQNLEWDCGIFWRVDRNASVLRCLDQWGASDAGAQAFLEGTWERTFKLEEGLPGRVWASGKAAWITDVVRDTNFPRQGLAHEAGFHGAFGFPVRVGGDIEGVIELYSRQVRVPDEELLKMINDVGLKLEQFGDRTRAQEALQQTEAQLRQSQKMEAVGRLAGGVAHDFNNLLTVIRGYSELLLARLAPDDSIRKDMIEVKKAADRASGLTRQLLAFSRRQFIAPKVIDLNALIANMDGMLRRLLGEDIVELCTELSPHTGSIRADAGQIEQVIMNLAVNARDAMPKGGRLTIETRNVTVGKPTRQTPAGVKPGSYVLLAVRDTGHGMDEETQSHLFEPFFTTKEKGKGTGLGLSTVYGIVKQTGGSIVVESQKDQGATFKIYFPLIDQSAPGTAGTPDAEPLHGRETILLVEDEPAVRGLVHETLRLHGYTVLEARHGIEALMTGAKHQGPIHLLLTDVVMPQMSGPEVAEKIQIVRPGIKVLYMSGYPDHPVFEQGGISREASFLAKPFTPNVLAKKVRDVLDDVKVG
ncbi:MAG TPA: PAS domain S-box protein [Nitrospira sp.]|nr:PAS domain S-box protein [Nitrospira sp.]